MRCGWTPKERRRRRIVERCGESARIGTVGRVDDRSRAVLPDSV
jgi:hypothetical protein